MKRILTILMLLVALTAAAQTDSPIRWRMTVSPVEGGRAVATVKALVAPGWHLYGTSLPADGPRPTEFRLTGSTGVKLAGKVSPSRAALTVADPMFGIELSWWDANVEFTFPLEVTDPDAAVLSITVSYMGCNNETCLPPTTRTLTYKFKK